MVWNFQQQLIDWGPDSNPGTVSIATAQDYCRQVTEEHYENFKVVSRLLPRELHQPFQNVYAFCRWADDLGDEISGAQASLDLLEWWRTELWQSVSGKSEHPVLIALQHTIQEFQIPIEPFDDLISAFEQDQVKTEYENHTELKGYCRLSADPVGRIVLSLFREATPVNFELSDRICTGLQLANFWQDVARDHDIGRLYLPKQDCENFGYTPEMILERRSTSEFQELLKYEVDLARRYLLSGRRLVDRLPPKYQVDIDLFVRGGLCILDRIAEIDYKTWETRPVVTHWDGARMFLKALLRKWGRRLGLVSAYPEVPPPEIIEGGMT